MLNLVTLIGILIVREIVTVMVKNLNNYSKSTSHRNKYVFLQNTNKEVFYC